MSDLDLNGFAPPAWSWPATSTTRSAGPTGASAVFGPQKGATPEIVAELDAALSHFADIMERDLGADVRDRAGAGAAGGLGAGLMALLDAELRAGVDIVLDAVGLDRTA